ncbi:MAG: hypothetical protein AAF517_04230 [Planctomycetota bacterium]
MQSFDLYLDSPSGDYDPQRLFELLEQHEHVHATPGDPSRFIYRNSETFVHFSVVVDLSLLGRAPVDEDEYDPYEDADERSVLPDEADFAVDEEDDEEAEGDAADETPAMPTVTVSIPLFRPRFFLSEAVSLLENLGGLDLTFSDPHEEDENAPSTPNFERLTANYETLHSTVLPNIRDPEALTRWTDEQASQFVEYGKNRGAIASQLNDDSVEVPILQVARSENGVRSLCVWRTNQSTVLPKCDLVLMQVAREKRGLLGRKTVYTDKVVSGSELWTTLSNDSEYREHPVPHLVHRPKDPPSQDLVVALSMLDSADGDSVKRTEFAGVIDFDIAPAAGEESSDD